MEKEVTVVEKEVTVVEEMDPKKNQKIKNKEESEKRRGR